MTLLYTQDHKGNKVNEVFQDPMDSWDLVDSLDLLVNEDSKDPKDLKVHRGDREREDREESLDLVENKVNPESKALLAPQVYFLQNDISKYVDDKTL